MSDRSLASGPEAGSPAASPDGVLRRGRVPEAGAAVLIVAASGRALAGSARRAGYRPLVADFFEDDDTRALSLATRRAGDPRAGFSREALFPALEALANIAAPAGFVYGAGLEDRIDLLEALGARFQLFGNPPATVRRAKDPAALARLCAEAKIAHPDIGFAPPADPQGWLVKSVGGAGGSHVAPADAPRAPGETVYFQRAAPGEPVSLLCLSGAGGVATLGSSRQWTAPAPGEPFRFGGCARPAGIAPQTEAAMTKAAEALCAALGLVGLNSFDFLVDGEAFTLIEINPRPGATLDIFEDAAGALFRAHIAACCGAPPPSLTFPSAAAAAIAYAPRPIAVMPALDWPCWAADRQSAGTTLDLNDPLCTIKAEAADAEIARRLAAERAAFLIGFIDKLIGIINNKEMETRS